MNFTEEMIDKLRDGVRGRLSSYRYEHTLGVEKAAKRLSLYIIPEQTDEIRVAALLHDITKELSSAEQLRLMTGDSRITKSDLLTEAAFHAFSAPEAIRRDFPAFVSDDVLSAVFNHTTGAPDMSLFDEIIFIADYIEDGRVHPECVEVRESLYSAISKARSREEMIRALHSATLKALDNTVRRISARGYHLNERTVITRDRYLEYK